MSGGSNRKRIWDETAGDSDPSQLDLADCKNSRNDDINGYLTCPNCFYNINHVSNEKCLHCSSNKAAYEVEEATKSTALDDTNTVIATPRVLSKHEYKPLFEVNDLIFGPWADANETNGAEQTWYPGRIKSYTTIKNGTYGPIRRYNLTFDDGDEMNDVEDYFIFSREDYLLSGRSDKWIGVEIKKDHNSDDLWAKYVDWYEANIGEFHTVCLLSMKSLTHL